MKIAQSSTNNAFEASPDFIEYSQVYKNMIDDLGEDTDEPLPIPEQMDFDLFYELYQLFNKIQRLFIDEKPYIDYFRDNYELFMNTYPRKNQKIPHFDYIVKLFSEYQLKTLCIFMQICDFFDMPIIKKIIGMGIATMMNALDNHDDISEMAKEIKQYEHYL